MTRAPYVRALPWAVAVGLTVILVLAIGGAAPEPGGKDDAFVAAGLAGLFVAALLAGSIVPLASEAVLVPLIAGGVSPVAAVVVATVGNVLGAVTVYAIGRAIARGGHLAERLERRFGDDPAALERARERLRRWGPPALLLAWAPIVGDPLVLAAGLVGTAPLPSLIATTVGKAARYAVLAWAVV